MTYLASFAEYMEVVLGVATRGQDLFIGEAPRQTTDNMQKPIWWIVASGGAPEGTDYNMWQRALAISVYYRNQEPDVLFEKFEELRSKIYANRCATLTGYELIDIEIMTELVDTDVDSEENKVGVMVIRLTVKQS